MATSNVPILRQRSLGELLDQAIRLYRNNFFRFIGIIAVIEVPLVLIQLIISVLTMGSTVQSILDPTMQFTDEQVPELMTQMLTGFGAAAIVGVLSFILIQGLATAALTRAIADNYLGKETGIEDAYSRIGGSWGTLIGALLLLGILSIVVTIWLIIPCIGWFTGIGMLFFLSLAVLPMLAPVVILERRGAMDAIARTWRLCRERFWWLVIYVTVLFFFNLLVVSGPVALLSSLSQGLILNSVGEGNAASLVLIQTILQSLMSLVLGLLYHPLQSACITLAYFDLRVRLEGFDLALLAAQSGETPQDATEMAAQAPVAPSKGPLFTWGDMGNFALLSLLAAAIYIIPVSVLGVFSGLLSSGF